MNKIKAYFKTLDKTKKLVIAFVGISFAIILSITIFNMLNNTYESQHTDTISAKEQKKDTKKTEKKEDDQKQDSEEQQDSSTETTQQVDENNAVQNESNEQSKEETNASNNVPVVKVETMQVGITIFGMNDEIIATGSISIEKNKSAYEGLKLFTDQNGIPMSVSSPGKYAYITSINNLSERAHGANSGWIYQVNHVQPNIGSGQYTLNDGDQMEWHYVYD